MFSSNLFKIFLLSVALLFQACGFWQGKTEETPAPFVLAEIKSEIPFLTREPEVYQTEIVVSSGGIEEKTFTARNDLNRLIVFDYQSKREIAVLNTGANQKFLINHNRKIFAEYESKVSAAGKEKELKDFLTTVWLNQKAGAKFENIGAENDLTKYRIHLDDAQNSEIVIFANEKNGLPVRQEFYSVSGEQRNLTLTMELRNFSLQADENNFRIPENYRKVAAAEFYEILRRERN